MRPRPIAIFDIGKTNKKFILLDETLQEIACQSEQLPETQDEDGFPCEDLPRLKAWMLQVLEEAQRSWSVRALNFSTYGASWVHLDAKGQEVGPLYNYLKPFPDSLSEQFFTAYGPEGDWSLQTASPSLGMLNSGLQLYWLQQERKEQFRQIHRSLHLPQYCSYLVSGQQQAEHTSLGCHTGLWDFAQNRYHRWVEQEGILSLMAPLVSAYGGKSVSFQGKELLVGPGIHDSSAALLPYLQLSNRPFLLLSTGTWNITLNPFSQSPLSPAALAQDCLNFMGPEGQAVRASRLFLGKRHEQAVQQLDAYYHKAPDFHRRIVFQAALLTQSAEKSYEGDYHLLMQELVQSQLTALALAQGNTEVDRLYIDGGFAQNDLFIKLLQQALPGWELLVAAKPFGSAVGAALAVCPDLSPNLVNTTRNDTRQT